MNQQDLARAEELIREIGERATLSENRLENVSQTADTLRRNYWALREEHGKLLEENAQLKHDNARMRRLLDMLGDTR